MDQLTHALAAGWRQFLEALHPDDRQTLLRVLREEYLEEAHDVVQFTQHAPRMPYPQVRARLLRIAEEEQAHVAWLQDKIRGLGGEIPATSFTPQSGNKSWDCLLLDLQEEKRCCQDLLERMHLVEQIDAEIAEGLRRMREEEMRHREEILDMLTKIDPYSLPPGPREGHRTEAEGRINA